ncbi:MAG: STN domain-containing protein [Blastocatellia bacterium]
MINRSIGMAALSLCMLFSATVMAQTSERTFDPKASLQNVSFKDAEFKIVTQALAEKLKLNLVFDDGVKLGDKVNVELRDVTAEQAMKIILIQKRYQARVIEKNTIIIFPDNEATRKRYEEFKLWPEKIEKKKS